jgi:hypothetical protein
MPININLFGHILLDAELNGRFGIQGNTFANTMHYFNDYLRQIKEDDLSEDNKKRLITLSNATQQLECAEERLRQFERNPQEALTEQTNQKGEDILLWTKELMSDILNLSSSPDEQMLLPGGWRNQDGGHAMLYQFTKNPNGDVVFKIYNSGAGLRFHAKDATPREDRYFPVKTFIIPDPISQDSQEEFNLFLYRLIRPRIIHHPARIALYKSNYNEKDVYQDIQKSMDFLNAIPAPLSDEPFHHTTAGQISGTCTQRSIHQMIKTQFDTLENYQRFILKFKMHALQEFINTHPNPHPEITELIILAIENNLKILQEPGVFDERIYQTLRTMKAHILENSPPPVYTPISKEPTPVEPFNLNAQPLTSFVIPKTLKSPPVEQRLPLYPVDPNIPVLEQLKTLYQACQNHQDPQWVMEQIEQVINKINLPSSRETFDEIPEVFWGVDAQQFKEIKALLEKVHTSYQKACQYCLGQNKLSSTVVTELSFLATHDYVHTQLATRYAKPSLHDWTDRKIQSFLDSLQHNPDMISVQPHLDQRLKQLQQIYPFTSESSTKLPSLYKYIDLIQREPILEKELKEHYEQQISKYLSKEERNELEYKNAEELYTLLSYFKNNAWDLPASFDKNQFEPTLQWLQEMIDFENHFKVSALHLGLETEEKLSDTLSLTFKYSHGIEEIQWKSPANMAISCKAIKQSRSLSPAGASLTPNLISLHSVQLSKRSVQDREFYHLRASPSHQVHLTLDYFKKNKSALLDKKVQNYLEANLLEPHRIIDALKQPSFLTDFNEFIQEGLQSQDFIYPDGRVKQEGLFLLRLSILVNRYLLEIHPKTSSTQHQLPRDYVRLNAQIKATLDPQILASLHRYRFMCLCAQENLLEDLDFFEQALTSYFYIHVHKNTQEKISTHELFDQKHLEFIFKRYLQQHTTTNAIQPILKTMVQTLLGKDIMTFEIQGAYPLYTLYQKDPLLTYTLQLEEGGIYIDEKALLPTPKHLLNHPLLEKLNLTDKMTCLQSLDGTVFEFPPDVRIKQNEKNEIIAVQKKWHINQEEAWYELQPSVLQAEASHKNSIMETRTLITPHLPKILNDEESEFWIKEGMVGSFIIQKDQPCYVLNEQFSFEQLDDSGQKNGNILQQISEIHNKFTSFESPDFFLVNLHPKTHTGNVQCPRYQLSFDIDADQTICLKDDKRFKLIANDFPFQPHVARLTFSDGKNTQCIVPVQKFFVLEKDKPEKGLYYHFIHDTNHEIESFIHPNNEKCYTSSCKSICYSMENGEPHPKNAAEALYLTYLYLGQHDHQKAWKILEDIRNHYTLTGSVEEQIYLSWIMYALPASVKGTPKDATLASPRDVVCQLKALGLYTTFLTKGKPREEIPYGHPQMQDVSWLNDQLPQIILTYYEKWIKMQDHLSASYHLKPNEHKGLLSYAASQLIGGADYALKKLKLQSLLTLKKRLENILNTVPNLPDFYKKRIAQLDQQIHMVEHVVKKTTTLQVERHSLQLNDKKLDYYKNLSLPSFKQSDIDFKKLLEDNKSPKFNSELSYWDLKQHFGTFLQIASMGRSVPEDPYLTHLKQSCLHHLQSIAHKALINASTQYDTDYATLVNILYRVLIHPECVEKLQSHQTKLGHLVNIVKEFELPDIEFVYEKDITTEILADAETIIQELEKKSLLHEPIIQQPKHSLPLRDQIAPFITEETTKNALEKGDSAMLASQRAYRESIENLNPSSPNREREAGILQYQLTQNQRAIAEKALASIDVREHLLQATLSYFKGTQNSLLEKWDQALTFANSELQNIQLDAGQHRLLTRNDLLQCYLHHDYVYSMERTHLSKKDCKQLHDLTHACLSEAILSQQAARLIHDLKQLDAHPDAIQLSKIAQSLLSETNVAIENDPALMLFQFLNKDNEGKAGIVLHKRQVEALQDLLSNSNTTDFTQFNESIQKVIMGGGKSKVLLPILAQKKATGTNLVIIEVPPALLETNYNDLKQSSQNLFKQNAFRFEFNRDSDCSPKRLNEIIDEWNDIIESKGYLVTTGESLQSLELKYLELLLSPPENESQRKIWNAQIQGMSQIITLLKQSGDAIIDEVHQGLLLKKKLNYTIGEPQRLPEQWIQLIIPFYHFLEHEHPDDLIKNFIQHPKSPLQPYLEELYLLDQPQQIHQVIEAYFKNEQEPSFLKTLDADLRDVLSFYKEQFRLYPQTQNQNYKVHYGPSKNPDKTAFERAIAIPYSANEKPNETSRFGNPFETMHYTIQSLLQDGLNATFLKHILQQWQTNAQFEFQTNPDHYSTIDETPTAKTIIDRYLAKVGVTSLQNIQINDDDQINGLLKKLHNHPDLILHVLEKSILKQITIEPEILHSDAYNHVDMLHSVQGVSGTPSNFTTYHPRFRYHEATSLGTDGYIEALIKAKKTPIRTLTLNTLEEFLPNLLDRNTHIRALIDIGATFAGISNLTIAQALAQYYVDKPSPIQYILYFNDQDELCAWDIQHKTTQILGTSDPLEINRLLRCKPENRVTYYDQAHTVGTDLKQATEGCGVCLINKKTQIQQFLQGCMRMRGLEEKQTLEIIVPEQLPEQLGEPTLDSWLSHMKNNETLQLREDNFYAALAKMHNWFRNQALTMIQSLDENDTETKALWAKAFEEHFFIDKQSINLEQFSVIYQKIDTRILLHDHKNQLMQDWETCLKKIHPHPALNMNPDLDLNQIIDAALPHCAQQSISPQRLNQGTEVQVQKEQLTKKEVQQLTQQYTESRSIKPLKYLEWNSQMLHDFYTKNEVIHPPLKEKEDYYQAIPQYKTSLTLNTYCQTFSHFSPQLQVSANYAHILSRCILFYSAFMTMNCLRSFWIHSKPI